MKRKIALAVLVSFSVAIGFLCLEVVVRKIDGIPVFSRVNFVSRALDVMRPPGAAALYDPVTGWVQLGNYQGEGKPSFTTGEFGVRMSNTKIVPLQENAVMAIGDSFTVGSEVADEESWPAQLEWGLGTQVINAAVGGYGVDQSLLRAEMLVPKLKPQVLLIEMVGAVSNNNNGMAVYAGAPKPYFVLEKGEAILHNVPVPRNATRPSDIGLLRAVFGYSYLIQFVMVRFNALDVWDAPRFRNHWAYQPDEGLRVTCALMPRFAKLQAQYGVKVAFVLEYGGPEPTTMSFGWDRPALLKCINDNGFQAVDIVDELHGIYEREGEEAYKRLWVMHESGRAYGHMSPSGNQLVARLIADQVFSKTLSESVTP